MKPIVALAAALAIAAGGLTTAAMPAASAAAAAEAMPPGECPERIGSAEVLVCFCPAGAAESGSVWGSEVFTSDSGICRAARHAGALGSDGGTIRVDARPGQDKYLGSTRNGVASSDWGAYDRSFAVARADWANGTAPDYPAGPYACPSSGAGLASSGQPLTCRCSAGAMGEGSVWGNGTYTTDSAICRAALHAGRLGRDGGVVSLRPSEAKSRYRGSTAHGVSSSDWGSYPTSFEFTR